MTSVGQMGTNGFTNDQGDREVAATALADHVLNNLEDGEDITLIGHIHGGNVAIQAVDKIRLGLGEDDSRSINLITIATPAYNGARDPENPANTTANSHTQFFSGSDAVQTTLANSVGSKTAVRTYSNPSTQNVRVNDTQRVSISDPGNPGMTRQLTIPSQGPINSHFIHSLNPQLLKR